MRGGNIILWAIFLSVAAALYGPLLLKASHYLSDTRLNGLRATDAPRHDKSVFHATENTRGRQ